VSLEQFLANITLEELDELRRVKELEVNKIPIYSFSKIGYSDLDRLFDIEKSINLTIFDNWLESQIDIDKDIEIFLKTLIDKNRVLINDYNEEDLKANLIIPILSRVEFKSFENEFRDFYELPLRYETKEFIFSGTTYFVVSKGLFKSKKPYFFIQEFKKSKENSDPEPQLIAELISAVEFNNWSMIRGAYIVGAIWNFVILERIEKHKYQYYVSDNFDSTKRDDLKAIYKNLLFVKNEIIDMIKNGD
jgi:hypothetical protein